MSQRLKEDLRACGKAGSYARQKGRNISFARPVYSDPEFGRTYCRLASPGQGNDRLSEEGEGVRYRATGGVCDPHGADDQHRPYRVNDRRRSEVSGGDERVDGRGGRGEHRSILHVPIIPNLLYKLEHPNDVDCSLSKTTSHVPYNSKAVEKLFIQENGSNKKKKKIDKSITNDLLDSKIKFKMKGDPSFKKPRKHKKPMSTTPTFTTTFKMYDDTTIAWCMINLTHRLYEDGSVKVLTDEEAYKTRHDAIMSTTVEVGLMFASKAIVQLIANPFVGSLTNKSFQFDGDILY
ncbi:hypothetical protein HELRODRAFT_164993 [Helobdella robusta]|uniref:Uncharacterized protein n=1 Tax=Helobdella robusta TaxID=6412 RepID=T1EW31_HELRO|nr:hypothetical protein HELRODRAFT_164993 [Helobdella robusta]ESN92861.1 hypothetical protein HELRODRAFT_164993 [Helobdella robusta]